MKRLALLLVAALTVDGQEMEISEVLPDNQGGLRDEDGETPGWLELRNGRTSSVNLAGWHLTDDPARPAKWALPAVTLPAGGYLTVLASGKDRAPPAGPVHAGFKLEAEGGYLALQDPAGVTVSAFTPGYPALRRNISCARTMAARTDALIPPGTAVKYRVPSGAEEGLAWTDAGYDDSAWASTVQPAGYDDAGAGSVVLALDVNDRDNSSASTTQEGFTAFVIGNTGGGGAEQTGAVMRTVGGLEVTLSNSGNATYDDRHRTAPSNSGALTTQRLLRDFVFSREETGNSGLDLTVAGLPPEEDLEVTLWSFDSSSLGNRVADWSANEVLKKENYTFNGSVLPATDTAAAFSFGVRTDPAGRLTVSGRRDSSSAGFGVYLNALRITRQGLGGVVRGDLGPALKSRNSGVYFRIPFQAADPGVWTRLRLKAKYDDGFVAYLNGSPVVSRQAPATPVWNSAATGARAPGQASVAEEILIPLTPGLLKTGANVLAVHGLNVSADDSDFLWEGVLEGLGEPEWTAVYFAEPTPGQPNAQAWPGVTPDPVFSTGRGLFQAPVTVALSCTAPGAVLRFTMDGSLPGPDSGGMYTAPLTVNGTTSLRAAAAVPGWIPSLPVTHTYVFPEQAAAQPANPPGWPATWGTDSEVPGPVPADYQMDPEVTGHTEPGYSAVEALRALPSLSLTLPPGDFLGPNGIYQNPRSTGEAWERAASLELMDPSGREPGFGENCLVEMHGNSSRRPFRVQKHSFRVTFSSRTGAGKLDYPLFPGLAVREFDKLVLRACFTDAWCLVSWDPARYRPDDATYLRDVWMKRAHAAMGALAPDSRYCHLYVNGLYWGIYVASERVDAEFVASHLGGLETDWEVIPDFVDPVAAGGTAWKQMFSAANAGLSSAAAYSGIQQWLDPVAFADYYLLHQYGEAEDWPHHNGYAFRRTSGPDTRFKWVVWDQEIALNNHGVDRVGAGAPNTGTDRTPGRLLQKLRDNAEFRLLFADRAHRHLHNGGALDIAPSQDRWSAVAGLIGKAIVAESARWGDTAEETPYGNTGESRPGVPLKPVYTREADWLPTVNAVRSVWIPSLHNNSNSYSVIRRLQAAGLYPATQPPALTPHGGLTAGPAEVTVTAPAGMVYYTTDGTDPREADTGNPRGALYGGSPLILPATAVVRARARNGTGWSALTEAQFIVGAAASPANVGISEIHYHPPDDSAEPEFIELVNLSDKTVDLSGAAFTEGITWTFPEGTLLAPGGRLAVTSEQFAGSLSNGGETLALVAADGTLIFRFTYSDGAPWPPDSDGSGASLVLIRPGLDPSVPGHWRSSTIPGGTPGGQDTTKFEGDPAGDEDGDGQSDFLEYALGTLTEKSTAAPAVGILQAGELVIVRFRLAAAADEAETRPEWSLDLREWRQEGVQLQSRLTDGAGRREETWSFLRPEGSVRVFVRIRTRSGG